jgi:uncharacterized protein YciI
MSHFAYRILPPRGDFAATLTSGEAETMGRHFDYIKALHGAGRIVFVGRTENGDWGLCVFEAEDEHRARAVAEADPAVAAGLMRYELHAFRTVFERGA